MSFQNKQTTGQNKNQNTNNPMNKTGANPPHKDGAKPVESNTTTETKNEADKKPQDNKSSSKS